MRLAVFSIAPSAPSISADAVIVVALADRYDELTTLRRKVFHGYGVRQPTGSLLHKSSSRGQPPASMRRLSPPPVTPPSITEGSVVRLEPIPKIGPGGGTLSNYGLEAATSGVSCAPP